MKNQLKMNEKSTKDIGIQPLISMIPDRYEPNNTIETALPWSQTTKYGVENHPWQYGYVSANIHDSTDEDYYSIDMVQGETYFFHIKNMSSDLNLILMNPEQTGWWGDIKTGWQEEYFYVQAPYSGKYYVAVWGEEHTTNLNYFLFAGNILQTRTLRMNTGLNFNILSGVTPFLTFDATRKAPWEISKSVLNSVKLTSNTTQSGNNTSTLKKHLKSTDFGRTYVNDGEGGELIDYQYRTEYVNQKWGIAGSSHTTILGWNPIIYMTYTGYMTPLSLADLE